MIIIGINSYHGDSSACIIVDGQLVAAVEEERFRRIKHWAGLPTESIRYCLEEARITFDQVDAIAINQDSNASSLFNKTELKTCIILFFPDFFKLTSFH